MRPWSDGPSSLDIPPDPLTTGHPARTLFVVARRCPPHGQRRRCRCCRRCWRLRKRTIHELQAPASLMRVRRACGSSVVSLSQSSGPRCKASPKQTPAYPPRWGYLNVRYTVDLVPESGAATLEEFKRRGRFNPSQVETPPARDNNDDMKRVTTFLLRL